MAGIGRKVRISTILTTIIFGTLLFKNAIVIGSPECSSYDFPCENGECIDAALWCDTQEDCPDGTDEKYCKKAGFLSSNPNKCPSTYFKCHYGPCIPVSGRCDGYNNCDDLSDEKYCEDEDNTYRSTSTTPQPLNTPPTITNYDKFEGTNAILYFENLNASHNSIQMELLPKWRLSTFSGQRQRSRSWFLSQRRNDFGFGDETPRAILALHLSDVQAWTNSNITYKLMDKQLELQFSLDAARNETKAMKLADLALYINALLSSCKDPNNFYGENFVRRLRNAVDVAHGNSAFVNPSVYLTLCMNNATTDIDVRQLMDIFVSKNDTSSRIDIQALALLSTVCVFQKTNLLNESLYDDIRKEFLQNVKADGFPGNVHEAALLYQALKEMKVSLVGLKNFILSQQQADGSFGDVLSTYLVLPILAGKNILHMKDHCVEKHTSDFTPIEVLQNPRGNKIQVQYSLIYGYPTEIKQTIQMQVPQGANVLDVMRLAQDFNPAYKFKLSENRKESVVYSIGEMPNDAEKGMFWTFHLGFKKSNDDTNSVHWVPYLKDIKRLILKDGDKVSYWFKPI